MERTWLDRLDEAFENKLRLAIVSALIPVDAMDFAMLKKLTGATDGNLGAQTRKLEDLGYLTCTKGFAGRKPRTTYRLTPAGRQAFEDYVRLLERVLRGTEGSPG